ncbi:MAG: HAMP domain-containing protein, partial [Chloroflexi bacterium]
MFNSLQSRLLLISAVVLAVAIATIAILASIYTGETFRGFVASDAQARTARIVLALSNHYQTYGIWDNRVQPLLDNMATTTGYYIFLYNPTGQPLYKSNDAGNFPQFPVNNVMPQPQGQAPNQGVNPGQGPRGPNNPNPQGNGPFGPRTRPNFEPFVPININNTIVGFIHTLPIPNAPAINQAAFQESNNINLLIAATVAGAVAVGLSYILARTVTAPLASLTRAAKRLAKGDLSQRVHITERGEIGELAEAFNMMAESLERNEQLRRNMVSDVAHELRTPLTNIRGYLEAMQDGLLEPKPELLASLYEETMLVNRLINDLQQL